MNIPETQMTENMRELQTKNVTITVIDLYICEYKTFIIQQMRALKIYSLYILIGLKTFRRPLVLLFRQS